jgi:predicted nucleotidyltransferase component of viral defense system
MLREYLQYKILATIFSHPLAQKLCFIGGTCLRIGYHSQRFSEDIDFDNRGLTPIEFETLTELVRKELINE